MWEGSKISIYCALITYKNSKYLDPNKQHLEFKKLIEFLDIKHYFIHDKDVTEYDKESIFVTNEFLSVLILAKSLLQTQLRILWKSKLRNFPLFFYHSFTAIYSIFYIIVKLLVSIAFPAKFVGYRLMIARQHNISEAHINLLLNSLNSNCEFSLILEDDFKVNNNFNIKECLSTLLDYMQSNTQTLIMSVSESFNPKLLGFKYISTCKSINGIDFYSLHTPITNTVSAMLYKTEILTLLIPLLESYRRYKIIPIDIKLNMALGELSKIDSKKLQILGYAYPGFFIQGSIHEKS